MTPEQCRAARGWLNLRAEQLAERARVPVETVRKFEGGKTLAASEGVEAMRAALERAGISFVFVFECEGVRGCGVTFTPP